MASLWKKVVPYLYLGGGACAGLAILYPNTIGLERYKSLVAIHNAEGQLEQVDADILKMADEIKKSYGWPKNNFEANEIISLFPTSSLELCQLGTTRSKWGSHIGIPNYYSKKFQVDDKYFDEVFKLMNIKPSSQTAKDIRQSCNISDAAKEFGLAREMKLSRSYESYFLTAAAQTAISSFYLIPNLVSSLLPYRFVRKITFVALIPLMYFTGFYFLKLSTSYSCKKADEAAASISQKVAEGGLEYYNAMLLRQQALSNVESLPNSGSDYFQLIVQRSWRDSIVSLQERKEHLEKIISTFKQQ